MGRFPGRRTALTLLTCMAGAGALAAPAAPAGAANPAPELLAGVNIGGTYSTIAQIDREMAGAHALHANAVRAEFVWAELEPNAAGQLDAQALGAADRIMSDAARYGIRVIAFVDGTPCWASSAPEQILRACAPQRSSYANSWPPVGNEAYAALMATLAHRYGTRLAGLEVWNEPDQSNQRYFAGPEKPARYVSLLRATYTAVKQANPQVKVLAGSLVGSNGSFLRALYAAGMKGYYDGLAVHFYTLTLGSLRSIREAQTASGDLAPLYLDEFGWSSCWPGRSTEQEQPCVTPKVQGENYKTVFRSLSAAPYVAAAVVYKLYDGVDEEFGVLTTRGARKPSFKALTEAISSPRRKPAPVKLKLGRSGGHVVASGSGPVGDYMVLEAFKGRTLRYHALFTLDRLNRFSLALPSVLGTRKLRVRVYQYWWGPARAASAKI